LVVALCAGRPVRALLSLEGHFEKSAITLRSALADAGRAPAR
jgi:hypothetical protein